MCERFHAWDGAIPKNRNFNQIFQQEIDLFNGFSDFLSINYIYLEWSGKYQTLPLTGSWNIKAQSFEVEQQPSWKTEYVAHFEFSNWNISLMNGRQVLKSLLGSYIGVI